MNGWANRETWVMNLGTSNDPYLYAMFQELVREGFESSDELEEKFKEKFGADFEFDGVSVQHEDIDWEGLFGVWHSNVIEAEEKHFERSLPSAVASEIAQAFGLEDEIRVTDGEAYFRDEDEAMWWAEEWMKTTLPPTLNAETKCHAREWIMAIAEALDLIEEAV